tara:strand:- start:370 stop:837 length:468 start_codon:yes stop_codon:yes gene_type:complete
MGPELALIATIVGTATSAVGAIKQGQAAAATGKYNAQVSQNSAQSARQVAAENERRFRRQTLKRQGKMRANMGSGAAAEDLLMDSAMEEELEALTIRQSGELRAGNFEQQAIIEKRRGKTAQQDARFSAAGTLLKGSSVGAGQYAKLPASSFLRL